jgi:hypothetical protein
VDVSVKVIVRGRAPDVALVSKDATGGLDEEDVVKVAIVELENTLALLEL